ncbi:unnamed protein product [Parnassius apollo]|uniref:(apollo) hypothetical protein n=1 Tax=Parnassius apollo TaxID=110799 RepID=A0A8S3X1L0_PARAO|nr:unnamed protein product [Parnassius apollo]
MVGRHVMVFARICGILVFRNQMSDPSSEEAREQLLVESFLELSGEQSVTHHKPLQPVVMQPVESRTSALAVCRTIGAKVSTAGRATGQSSAVPAWRKRIEERIAKARALIGGLICFRSGNNRPRIVRTVRIAFAGTNVSLSQPKKPRPVQLKKN